MHQTHENAGPHARQCVKGQAAVLHCLPRGLQQQAVLRVHLSRFALGDPEELGVEVGDVFQKRAPLADRPARHSRLRVVELLYVPAVRWNLGDKVVTT